MESDKRRKIPDEAAGATQALNDKYLRPAERVMNYLMSEFDRPNLQDGCRLPSVRQLAKQLNVSTATVQNVFGRLSKMGRIRSEVGNGSFLVASRPGRKAVYRIGLNIPLPSQKPFRESNWTFKIYGGILHGMLRSSTPVMIESLPLDTEEGEGSWEKLARASKELDGLILYPSRYNRRLRGLFRKEGRPFVDLNPASEEATVNFLSPDYYGASRKLGKAWKDTGRKRIALVMQPSMENSVSVRLRCNGLMAGLGEGLGRDITVRIFEAPDFGTESGYGKIRDALAEGFVPDAVYTAGDPLALGALEALKEHGLSVPEEVSVVGGSGLSEEADYGPHYLTGMPQPLEEIGGDLIGALMKRISNPAEDVPGKYYRIAFSIGNTTRDSENALLHPSCSSP